MSFSTQVQTDIGNIIDKHGTDVSVYLTPVYTDDDEGNHTSISKGTETEVKAWIETPSGEIATAEIEGIDLSLRYRAFLKHSVGTITERSMIAINSEYYEVVNIEKNPADDAAITFYSLMIERLPDQNIIS